MSSNKMWFGNRNYMQWVECPKVGATYGSSGSALSMDYRNGGSFRRNSLSAARTFTLSWALTARDNIRAITDYADGVYGTGNLYWADPFVMDKNMLSQQMATPSLGGYDGIILNGQSVRPTLIATTPNTLGYPTQSATYTNNAATDVPFRHYVPIPAGYTAWVGMTGVAGTGGTVSVRTTLGLAPATGTALTPLAATDPTRFNYSVDASPTVDGIEVYLSGTGTVTLTGLMVQLLPTGVPATSGPFISGQGSTGCDWNTRPSIEAYSAALDLVGLSIDLVETGAWK